MKTRKNQMKTNSETRGFSVLCVCAALTALCPMAVRAKTIAVWPIENGRMDSLVSRGLRLKANEDATFSADNVLPWMAPPNPDKSKHSVEIPNREALWAGTGEVSKMLALGRITHEDIGSVLCSSSDFTLEGWIYIRNLPQSTGWYVIGNVCGGAHSAVRCRHRRFSCF